MKVFKNLIPPKHWLPGLLVLLLFTGSCANKPGEFPTPPTPSDGQSWWAPSQGDRYQIQLDGYPLDLEVAADIFELDVFEAPPEAIQALHARGLKVVCYINAGAWEEYRLDSDAFPAEVYRAGLYWLAGRKMAGYQPLCRPSAR